MRRRPLMEAWLDLVGQRWWNIRPTDAQILAVRQAPKLQTRFARTTILVARDGLARAMRSPLREHSAAISYNMILSVVPLLAILLSFFKFFGGLDILVESIILPKLFDLFNEQVAQVMAAYLRGFLGSLSSGELGAAAFLTLLLTVTTLMGAIEMAFNRVLEFESERPLVQRLLNYWLLLTLTPFVVVVSVSKSTELLGWVADLFPGAAVPEGFQNAAALRVVAAFAFECVGFTILYWVLPSRRVALRYAALGGLCAAIGFESLQWLNHAMTSRLFGDASLLALYGRVPIIAVVFFIWLRLVSVVLLLGMVVVVGAERCMGEGQGIGRSGPTAPHPLEGLHRMVRVFDALVRGFGSRPTGQNLQTLARESKDDETSVGHALQWLVDRGLAWESIDQGAGTPHLLRNWHPTLRALELHRLPQVFLSDAVGIKLASSSSVAIESDEAVQDFPAKIRQLISAAPPESFA